ncbi:alpha-L-arabinofuranosidase C-terminal domain-containing protein [uncultured Microbacterium sp.]|uniref:alpha-N-arabinofuranosidase n=1 Tax=uncultured Microbacterium sp. TaxID=191216 RepID=UPI0025E9B818|nr:alpha-L-arabinofuranosidase C-terminal domain-containing protein [uncultured Microbacterium sp.]
MTAARLTVDPRSAIGPVRRRLFGGFVEHLGRHMYDGLYEPGHPQADERGFRRDVVALVRELGVSTIRYPGGNFVSGFRWEDSVGPRGQRPRRLDLAWHSTETNEVGLHEFADWLEAVGSDLMLAVNLGTRGTLEAIDLLEYANVPDGSTLSQQRIDNGRIEPLDVRVWCLGNEMDGPWQLGHRSADDAVKPTAIDDWPIAPRLLEDVYSVQDAVVFGSLLISLLAHADRVASASLAQLVNVIAPIMTEPGGPAWRQTTFFPFALTSRLARGTAVRVPVETPTIDTATYGAVPAVTAVATTDADAGEAALFLAHRGLEEPIDLEIDLRGLGEREVVETHLLHDDDLSARNTRDEPERVRPRAVETRLEDGILRVSLPPVAWAALALRRVG